MLIRKLKYYLVYLPLASLRILFTEGFSALTAKMQRHIQQKYGRDVHGVLTAKLERVGRRLLEFPPVDNIRKRFPDSRLAAYAERWCRAKIRGLPDMDALKAEMKAGFARELSIFLESGDKLEFPLSAAPRVSIVLVLYNQAPLTYACMKSVLAEAGVEYEVIIVDNASGDETGELLGRMEGGVRIIRNRDNAGFLKAVNQGAEHAAGEYILLLNNDATLTPGALAQAVATAGAGTDVGAVGARLVLPDGSLQEAGSIIWNDGSCLGYGRGDRPEAGEYMFSREVDFCSGAFLLVRAELFRRLGGFDELFAPCYYEETDFCMRLKAAGFKVVYDPRVKVHHYEFASSGSREAAVEMQMRNREKFVRKHREVLEKDHLPPSRANVLRARASRREARRILVFDDRVPHHWLGSGFPRAAEILRGIRDTGCFCTFYPLQFPLEGWDEVRRTVPVDVEVMLGHGVGGLKDFLNDRAGYYDTMFVSRPHNMKAVRELYASHQELFAGVRIIYEAEALFSLREINQARFEGRPLPDDEAARMIKKELELAGPASRIVTVSPVEAKYFRDAGFKNVHTLGHSAPADPTGNVFGRRSGFLFVGNLDFDPSPNTDSVIWFAGEVLPKVAEGLGAAAVLKVAGSNKAARVNKLAGERVHILGRVPDLTACYDEARVFVAPTRFSAGIPIKVIEAAARGVPVVATGLLAGQLGWKDGEELLVADEPGGFADACIRLHSDPELWGRLRERALRRVKEEYSQEAFRDAVKGVLSGAAPA